MKMACIVVKCPKCKGFQVIETHLDTACYFHCKKCSLIKKLQNAKKLKYNMKVYLVTEDLETAERFCLLKQSERERE